MSTDWSQLRVGKDYWIHVDWLEGWIVPGSEQDKEENSYMQRGVSIYHYGVTTKFETVNHMNPLTKKDFNFVSSFPFPRNAEIHCIASLEPILRQVLPSSMRIIKHTKQDLPPDIDEVYQLLDERFRKKCGRCTGTGFNSLKLTSGRYEKRPCYCMGMGRVPSITNKFRKAIYAATDEFWRSKPWLLFRMNHTLRVVFPDGRERYFQVVGGSGTCDVMLLMVTRVEFVQNEFFWNEPFKLLDNGWYTTCRCEWITPKSGISKLDLEFLRDHKVALPDSSNPDPFTQKVLPVLNKLFMNSKGGGGNMLTSMTVDELEEMAVGLKVFSRIIPKLEPLPGTTFGDRRQYYSIDLKMDIDSQEVHVIAPPFPATHPQSPLQRIAFVTRPPFSVLKIDQEPIPYKALEILREILGIKALGTDEFENGQYAKAYESYSKAIKEFKALLAAYPSVNSESSTYDYFFTHYANILSNRARSGLKIGKLKQVIEDSTEITTIRLPEDAREYPIRCLYTRAKAYMGLEMFDKAQKDWEKLLTFQGLPNCQHLIPSMEEVRKEINLAKQQGTAVDSRVLWRKMYISNVEVFSRRHFHTAVLDQGSVIVFGGYTSLEPKEYVSGPSLLCRLKLGSKPGSTWEIIHATGTIPPQMAHHTAVTYERGMYVFGGITDPSVIRASQMYRLDLDTFEWTAPLYPGQLRAEISGHSAQVYKNEMIIFGGDLPDCGGNSNFTRIFNFETNKWSTITGKKLVPARHEHMSWISDSKMYIFGGFGQLVDPYDGSALIWEETKSDVYAFDLEKKEWLPQPVDVQGPLAPRSQAQAACLAGKAVYLFGGIATTEYDLVTYYESGIRFSITDSGVSATGLTTSETVCPDARAGSTLTLDPENRRAILIGGYNAKRLCVFGDVWELSVTKRSKNEPDGGIGICAFCGKENILRKCSGCKAVGYCNAECQKSGWKEHKKDCKK